MSVRCERSSRPCALSSGRSVSTVSTLDRMTPRLFGSTSPITSGQRGLLPWQLCSDVFPAQKQRPLECRNSADMDEGEKKGWSSSKVQGCGADQLSPSSFDSANHL